MTASNESATSTKVLAERNLRIAELETEIYKLKHAVPLTEAPLSAREALLAEAEKIAHLGSWIFDLKTGQVVWSRELFRILGLDPDKDTASTEFFMQAIHPEDSADASNNMESLLKHGKMKNADIRMYRTDGALRDILTNGAVLYDAQENPIRAVGTIMDVTEIRQAERERKQLEIQLRQAQKMEVVGRVAGGVAHDFNNILSIISGNADLLMEKNPDERLHHIRDAAELGAALTRQLLAFSRQAIIKPEPLEFNQLVLETVRILSRLLGEDVQIKLDLVPQTLLVMADRGQIQQILLNLAVNARDAMPMGGLIIFQSEEIVKNKKDPWLKFSVKDTGTGMDQKIMDQAFEPFFTTKDPGKGTGLGLSTIRDIVSQAGGNIQITSEPGQGTEVTVMLPIHQSLNIEKASASSIQNKNFESILVVEDNANLRDLISTFLKAAGFTVNAFGKPGEAEMLWKNSSHQYDLLITDILMPGINGYDLAKTFTAHKPDLKTLFISGYSPNQKNVPNGAFLQKPFTRSELLITVRELLDKEK